MMNTIKATVIVDNIPDGDLNAEWGLAVYIEYGDKKILLDTGSSELFIENSDKLGIDINDIDHAVLSHAHYDHAGGMEGFFIANEKASFYIQKSCEENCYRKKSLFKKKYIGLPAGILENYLHRFTKVDKELALCEGAYIISHRTPDLWKIGRREKMYTKVGRRYIYDDFSHEQSLVLRTEKGLVIFNSCSHGGAYNIINEINEAFPGEKVYAIVGGFHLYNKTEEEVRIFADKVRKSGVQVIYTGHCTGDEAFAILKNELGDVVNKLHCGLYLDKL